MNTESDPTDTEKPRRGFPVRFLVYALAVAAVLAIVIPSFRRARSSPGESPYIGEIRTMMSAQTAYQSANAGFYDSPRCLVDPQRCIPHYTGPSFLDARMLAETRYGYRWTFHAGSPAPPNETRAGRVSLSSLETYAYVAVPVASASTDLRGYCGDSTGLICYTTDGVTPRVERGACAGDPRCRPLR